MKKKIISYEYDEKRNFLFLNFEFDENSTRKVIISQKKIDYFSQYYKNLKDFVLNKDTIQKLIQIFPYIEVVRVYPNYTKLNIKNNKVEIYNIIDLYKE